MKLQVEEIRPYTTKTGKTMYFIKTPDGQEMSTFDDLSNYKQGDYLEGEVTQSDKLDKNGKPYKNFKLPRKTDLLEARIEKLEEAMKIVKQLLKQKETDERPDFLKDSEEEVIPF